MYKDITIESQEFHDMYVEISKIAEAKRQREILSDSSFREWFCLAIQTLASKLGYHITNLYEFTLDMGYSLKKGFVAGRELAKSKSLRSKERGE